LELVDEEDEVLEARIEVVLQAKRQNHLEMRVIDMCVYSEKPFEYCLYHC
jgi:hypothetical protein